MAPNPWPARTTRSPGSPPAARSPRRPRATSLGEGRRVVGRLGRRVRQPVAAQVHRDDAPERRAAGARPASTTRPCSTARGSSRTPGTPARRVAGPPQSRKWIRSPGVDHDDEAVGLGCEVRRRQRAPSPLGYGRHGQAPPGRPKRSVPSPPDTARSRSWSTVALDAIPEPFASRARRGRDRHRRRAVRRAAARERHRAGRDAVRPVRGRAADGVGRRLGRRSRTGSRSSGCRSRRTSPIRTTSPTRSGSRSSTSSPTTSASTTTGSTSSASTDRRQLGERSPTAATRPSQPDDERDPASAIVSQRNRRRPGAISAGSRSPPGRTWSRPNVAWVSPTNITTCGATEIARAV